MSYVRVNHGPEMKLVPIYCRKWKAFDEERAGYLNDRVRDLREAGISYPAIAVVLAIYEELLLNEVEVRSWCQRLGCPINPNKARPRAVAA